MPYEKDTILFIIKLIEFIRFRLHTRNENDNIVR